MPEEAELARHVVVSGRVQGVGFRAWVQDRAVELGLGGWVRNTRDGHVEAVFVGDAVRVQEMIEACRRGPSVSRVSDVAEREARADELSATRPGERFSVLPTR